LCLPSVFCPELSKELRRAGALDAHALGYLWSCQAQAQKLGETVERFLGRNLLRRAHFPSPSITGTLEAISSGSFRVPFAAILSASETSLGLHLYV
jgi:hypothetical protein